MGHTRPVIPDPQYVKASDGVHIAYKVFGEGGLDLLWPEPFTSLLEHVERFPPLMEFLERLASSFRVVMLDPRGVGLSDRVSGALLPSLEMRMADMLAVMDAVGSRRAAIFGWDDTGPLAILFAATHPDRAAALLLYDTGASASPRPDYPFGWDAPEWDAWIADIAARWGSQAFADDNFRKIAPSLASDPALRREWASVLRLGSSPGAAIAVAHMERETDVGDLLPAIQVPTLVMTKTGCQTYSVEEGRHLASRIPGARFLEIPGADHLPWAGDSALVIRELEGFLAEVRDEEAFFERVLATVMFTDIVGSTERVVALTDRRWREVVERHHSAVRAMLARYRGVEIDTAGDGFFASFDGPARAVRCAQSIIDAVRPLDLEIRAGVHTGEVETINRKVGGLAVAIGARVGSLAAPSEVLVSQTVKDLVAGSGLQFTDRGTHVLKGVPDEWHLYAAARTS
jgi:class 3 adenylate cyclase